MASKIHDLLTKYIQRVDGYAGHGAVFGGLIGANAATFAVVTDRRDWHVGTAMTASLIGGGIGCGIGAVSPYLAPFLVIGGPGVAIGLLCTDRPKTNA